jgi:DNA transformation protein
MASLTSLRNVGTRSSQWLQKVGINRLEDLIEVSVVDAYLRAKAAFPDQVSLNLLYALQGGMLDINWLDLPHEMKEDLRKE